MKAQELYEEFKDVDPVQAAMTIDQRLCRHVADLAEARGVKKVHSLIAIIREMDDLRSAVHRKFGWPCLPINIASLVLDCVLRGDPPMYAKLKSAMPSKMLKNTKYDPNYTENF